MNIQLEDPRIGYRKFNTPAMLSKTVSTGWMSNLGGPPAQNPLVGISVSVFGPIKVVKDAQGQDSIGPSTWTQSYGQSNLNVDYGNFSKVVNNVDIVHNTKDFYKELHNVTNISEDIPVEYSKQSTMFEEEDAPNSITNHLGKKIAELNQLIRQELGDYKRFGIKPTIPAPETTGADGKPIPKMKLFYILKTYYNTIKQNRAKTLNELERVLSKKGLADIKITKNDINILRIIFEGAE
jgi:hypothetical protein